MSIYYKLVQEQEQKYAKFINTAKYFLQDVGSTLKLENVDFGELAEIGVISKKLPMSEVSDKLTKEEIIALYPKYLELYLDEKFAIRTYASWMYAKVEFDEESFTLSVDLKDIIFGLRGEKEGEHRELVLQLLNEMQKSFFNTNSHGYSYAEIDMEEIKDPEKLDIGLLKYSLDSIGFSNVNIIRERKSKEEENEGEKLTVSFFNKFDFSNL